MHTCEQGVCVRACSVSWGVHTPQQCVCPLCAWGVCRCGTCVCTGCVDVGVGGGHMCEQAVYSCSERVGVYSVCIHTRVCTLATAVCVCTGVSSVFALCEYSVGGCVCTHTCVRCLCALYIGVRAHMCAGVVCTMCEPCAIMAIHVRTHTRVQVCV